MTEPHMTEPHMTESPMTEPTACFTASGQFYRGNLHTHSTGSDGVLDPGEVCRRYRAEGYDFIALTDHFVGLYGYPITDTAPFRDAGFTTILGAEMHTGHQLNGAIWHILAVGLPADFPPPNAPHFLPVDGSETAADIARRARDAGAFVAFAHPQWSGLTESDVASVTAAHAVEVYNHGCAMGCDRSEGFLTLEHLLNDDRRLSLIATDDAHFCEPDHFGGWVMVKARENSPEALLSALKSGSFYSSQGPELRDIRILDHSIQVDCSAVVSIIVQGSANVAKAVHGQSLTTGEITLDWFANSPWIRVSLIDRAGKRAWSNPIWLDE